MKTLTYLSSLLLLLTASASQAIEGEFVTIIGPDGHPMVVPLPSRPAMRRTPVTVKTPPAPVSSQQVQSDTQPATPQTSVTTSTPKTDRPATADQVDKVQKGPNTRSPEVSGRSQRAIQPPAGSPVRTPAQTVNSAPAVQPPPSVEPTPAASIAPAVAQQIDGQTYYPAEVLEQKEFNLTGKKRFYQIPTSSTGGPSWQVIEREKGADMSWFKKRQQAEMPSQPIVLGRNYAVIGRADLLPALPMQCVDAKAQRRARELNAQNQLGLFPKPGLTASASGSRFDFELVKFAQPVRTISLLAFADRQQGGRYYWPLAVFLDQNGCVLEGASAFYTQSHQATALQQAALEGILNVPEGSRYLLLTPLEHAIDVPDAQLTNQGQLKLTVLRQ